MVKKCQKIYLAGGFRSGWQNQARQFLPNFEILDPSAHGIQDPDKYTKWDLEAVRQSDLVLANMEASNPGGYALVLEIGFAKALGKYVILVEQHDDPIRHKYFEMVRQVADVVFSDLSEALEYIRSSCSG